MIYKVGIDVGSTTLKTVVLDENDQIVEKSYKRHMSKVRETTLEHLESLGHILQGHQLKVAVTGSAGLGISKEYGLGFVQEVFATAGAVRRDAPATDVVIELGGEDAKIIFFGGVLEDRMNGTCAGGTGSFIDQMATLLGVSIDKLDELSAKAEKIYPIASRCGVFAKSDIQPLLNQGARKEDLAASIFQAVVEQTIAGLAQGRKIEGNVLFLGGPLSFMKGLQRQFTQTLNLDENSATFPELAPNFVALGSAYHAATLPDESALTYDELIRRLRKAPDKTAVLESQPPLFESQAAYDAFKSRHDKMNVEHREITGYSGRAYLGIDAGSTTTKLVLLAEDGAILYKHYVSNGGNPLPVVKAQLEHIHRLCAGRIEIAGSAVTGYGEELMREAFGIDHGLVETLAHFTAARHFDPDVDFIIDIGGQDIKCFTIRDGGVDDVILNEACSSGCGSFIQTFATSLGYEIDEFARLALFAENPVDLGTRCTVFMNSSVKQAQKDGCTVGDISAGLAISVIKNALYKVIRARSADELGSHIVVQGGTFLNDAVLRSFEQELGRDVVRLSISELMGAYGSALHAIDRAQNVETQSSLITSEGLEAFTHSATPATCRRCTNNCALTVNTFGSGKKFISGNKCELGAGAPSASELPNLVAYKYEKLHALPKVRGNRPKVGIPLVMNIYDTLPFWAPFFDRIGCDVVLSGHSNRELYMHGQATIPSDTVCYPAKIAHGHIEALCEQNLDFIFYPCMTYNFDEGIADNNYNCPVVAYYPEAIGANVANLRETKYLCPHLSLNDEAFFLRRVYPILEPIVPGLTKDKLAAAARAGYTGYAVHQQDIQEAGSRALEYATQHGKRMIVLAGRPYHIDPEIIHGIDKLLTSLGFVVLTDDSVPRRGKPQLNILNQWTYHARMFSAAKFVAEHETSQLIQLVSFGCGLDAVTSDEVRDILRSSGKFYTQLKIDEISNLGAAKIRLRSLLAAIKEREGKEATAHV
ncbi:MAG: acyl-CoA dehydratase activase [Oscillospiraceae bacterium]|nr:acyl-CoA dehydratase activase [Oscillospiraceae bacterium]